MFLTTCISLLHNCKTLKQLKQIHAQLITQGLQQQPQHISCLLIKTYTKFSQAHHHSQTVFDQIPNPDLISWTSLMSHYLQIDHPKEALSIFVRMIFARIKPDEFVVVSALSACARLENLNHGRAVHAMIYRYGIIFDIFVHNSMIEYYCRNGKIQTAIVLFNRMSSRNVITWTSLIHGFVRCKDLESARQLFDEMPQRNAISWTAIITGYIHGGNPLRALQLFCQMRFAGEFPTEITIVAVLSACADIGALHLGKCIHGYMNKTNLNLDTAVSNALIDMYSKSGNLKMAVTIFERMKKRDVYSWTTMIFGFGIHGDGHQANQTFREMVGMGEKPNEITFLAVLSACSHGGLVEHGRKWFDQMQTFYHFKPKIKHYGCMVDLLGRAGLLEEAKELINEIGVKTDSVIWRSLLSACLVHGHVELAEFAGRKIIELEPDDDGVYALLWNMYATENRWGKALEMRKKMKCRGVKKRPGCSWIEVNGVVHEFLVEDKTHHLRGEIYSVLEGMSKQMRQAGV